MRTSVLGRFFSRYLLDDRLILREELKVKHKCGKIALNAGLMGISPAAQCGFNSISHL
jgi:hypothetical protein